ncbi:c-type cytochrome [Methylocella tundrae]|nr:transporter substrate-binding domain-containing protein [Methylocella tundrae]
MRHREEASFGVPPRKPGIRCRLLAALASVLFVTGSPPGAFALPADANVGGDFLNLCADPDDLPFSSQSSSSHGLYFELGEEIANSLGRPLNTVWSQSYFGKRTIRENLLAGKCDAYIGLPDSKNFMGPKLIFSKPFLHVGYALVSIKERRFASLDDLKGKRVAVQFATSPELLLADHDEIKAVTFLDPEAAMKALAADRADAAIIWGPSAGYLNKALYRDAYTVQPVTGEGMQWPVSIGFAHSQGGLRDQIDRIIEDKAAAVAALAVKYGFPQAEPVSLTNPSTAGTSASEAKIIPAAGDQTASDAQNPPPIEPAGQTPSAVVTHEPYAAVTDTSSAAEPPARASDPATIAEGRETFNGTCSHCHGPDAVVGQRKINLRLLSQRYGDKMDEVFHFTVTHGRPDKGMPNWTGVFSEDDFSKILAWLHSVQQPSEEQSR